MLFLLCVGFLMIILIDVPPMLVKGWRRELRTFWVLLGLAFAYALAVVLNWPIPNPTLVLEAIFKPIAVAVGLP